MEALPAPIDYSTSVVRSQVLIRPEREVPTVAYNYGPYVKPNNLPPLIDGIPETSPLHDYRTPERQYRLCWFGYEDPSPDWVYPHVCDISIPGAREAFQDGTIWVPKKSQNWGTDHLLTLGEPTEDGGLERRAIGATVQSDGTVALTLVSAGNIQDILSFEFVDTSQTISPGSKTITLDAARAEQRFGPLDDWQLDFFYVCDHPTNGRIVYLADPYSSTNATDFWTTVPCQVARLQLRYWLEDFRPRDLTLVDPEPGDLAVEDPENMQGNFYDTITLYEGHPVPWRIHFIDEDGEIEPEWTTEELAARRLALDAGQEYVRPYILEMRQERAAAALNIGDEEYNLQESTVMYAGAEDDAASPGFSNPLFRSIIAEDGEDVIIEEQDSRNVEELSEIPEDPDYNADASNLDTTVRFANPRDVEAAEVVQGHNRQMQHLLNRVMGIGNQIHWMGLQNAGRVPDDPDLPANTMGRGNNMMISADNNDNYNGGVNANRRILPVDQEYWYSVGDGSQAAGAISDGNQDELLIDLEAEAQQEGYCWRVFGQLCETLTGGVGRLFGRTSAAPVGGQSNRAPEVFSPRPIAFDELDETE